MTGSMNYHSNTPGSRAAVNRENLIRQVAGNPAPQDFGVGQLVASAGVNAPGYRSPWRKDQPEEESRDQSAQMRGHADLGSRKIECDLDCDDQRDICEALSGQRCMMVS